VSAGAPSGHGRIVLVDVLRGFALFGVYGANLMIFSGLELLPESGSALFSSGADRTVRFLEAFLVENKFMGLFSFLFGVSFWLFLGRVRGRGVPPTRLFYRRIGWLFVFGGVHGWLLWAFDILRFYALWAVFLPFLARVRLRALLALAFFLCVLAPAVVAGIRVAIHAGAGHDGGLDAATLQAFAHGTYLQTLAANWRFDWALTLSIGQLGYQLAMFGRLVLGLWVARALDLERPGRHRALLVRVLVVGLLVGVPGNLVFALEAWSGAKPPWAVFLRKLLVEGGHLGFTLAFAAGLSLFFLRPRSRALLAHLAPPGQMALSVYLLQTVLGIWLFYGFPHGPQLMARVGPGWLGVLWLVGFVLQVALAGAWMRRFRFGPMEWLWRTLTWGELQPLIREARPAA